MTRFFTSCTVESQPTTEGDTLNNCVDAYKPGADLGFTLHYHAGEVVLIIVFNIVDPNEYAIVNEEDYESLLKFTHWSDVVTFLGKDVKIN